MGEGAAGSQACLAADDRKLGYISRVGSHYESGKTVKKKLVITALSLSAFTLACCVLVFYAPATGRQREVWRSNRFHWLDGDSSWIAGNVLLIGGYKGGPCFCLYALDKNTGWEVWSTEALMAPYIEEQQRTDPDSPISPSAEFVGLSPTQDLVYILANYKALIALDTATGQVRWKQDIREMGIYSLQDAITENEFYAIDRDQNLIALKSSDGQVIWKQPLGLSEDDNVWLEYQAERIFTKIMLASGGAKVISFKARSGEKISEITERTVALTVVAGDTLIVNNADSQQEAALYLTGFDIPSGQELWEEQLGLRPYDNHKMKPPIVMGGEVYLHIETVRDAKGYSSLLVFDQKTGIKRWSFNDDFSRGEVSFLVQGDAVYMSVEDGWLYALDRFNGTELWKNKAPGLAAHLWVVEDTLYASFKHFTLQAINAANGQLRWEFHEQEISPIKQRLFSDPYLIYQSGTAYVETGKPKIFAIDPETGTVTWTWQHNQFVQWYSNLLPMSMGYSIVASDNDKLYVLANGNCDVFLVALDAR